MKKRKKVNHLRFYGAKYVAPSVLTAPSECFRPLLIILRKSREEGKLYGTISTKEAITFTLLYPRSVKQGCNMVDGCLANCVRSRYGSKSSLYCWYPREGSLCCFLVLDLEVSKCIGVLRDGDDSQEFFQVLLLEVLLGQVLEVSLGEGDLGLDND